MYLVNKTNKWIRLFFHSELLARVGTDTRTRTQFKHHIATEQSGWWNTVYSRMRVSLHLLIVSFCYLLPNHSNAITAKSKSRLIWLHVNIKTRWKLFTSVFALFKILALQLKWWSLENPTWCKKINIIPYKENIKLILKDDDGIRAMLDFAFYLYVT